MLWVLNLKGQPFYIIRSNSNKNDMNICTGLIKFAEVKTTYVTAE
jgi:hypothetical protein